MSDTVEPPKSPLEKLWQRVPENMRLPVLFGAPALLVLAAMPLLFREGSAKKRTVALETRQDGASSPAATNDNGLFLSRNQPAPQAPAPVQSSEPAAPAPASSLMRPTDGAAYAGPPLPGQAPAAAPAAEAAPAAAAAEGGLEESEGVGDDAASARGPVDMAAMMAAAGAAGGKPKLAAKSSQFSYSGGVGNGTGGSSAKQLKGFSFKKKADKAGTGIGGAGASRTTLAAAGMGDSAAGKNAAKDMIQQSGAGKVLGGLGMGGALGGALGGDGGASGGLGGGGDGPTGGSSGFAEGDMSGADSAMESAKKCKEADRIYSPQIKQASTEYGVLQDQRYKALDCRGIGCGYQNYGDCEAYARNQYCNGRCGPGKQFADWAACQTYATNNPNVYYNWWLKPCRCGQIACRAIAKCQHIDSLNCAFSRMCPAAGRPCGGSDCR